ncbi:MAG: trypsin-like peptidase domain-containing protein [bacterium]|nr:trypsin-like peptidase domain-containing protein [bacterium]
MSDFFKQLSDSMADVAESTAKGLVTVAGRKRMGATGIVWRDGVVVTASHVITKDEGIKIGTSDGAMHDVTLVGRDNSSDVAVLRVAGNLAPVTFSDNARVGQLVLAIGKPSSAIQATLGVVSAVGTGDMEGFIQTDVLMYPGFSGGALVSGDGGVLGMNTSGFNRGQSVAISTTRIHTIVETLLTHGKMKRGYLGVGLQAVRLPSSISAVLSQETGLMLVSVEADSPAEKGGLFMGDVVVALDGHPTPHLDALYMVLNSPNRIGKTVVAKVVRGGQMQEIPVTIGEKA